MPRRCKYKCWLMLMLILIYQLLIHYIEGIGAIILLEAFKRWHFDTIHLNVLLDIKDISVYSNFIIYGLDDFCTHCQILLILAALHTWASMIQ